MGVRGNPKTAPLGWGGVALANGVGTNFAVGVGEARPEGSRVGDEVLGEGQPAPPHQMGGCGSDESSPPGSGAEPRPSKGFLVFCAVRLPFPASQYVLHTVCMARY